MSNAPEGGHLYGRRTVSIAGRRRRSNGLGNRNLINVNSLRSRLAQCGQNLQNSRSQSATTITAANVGTLQQAWVFTAAGDISATPAVSNGTVYFPDYGGYFYAVNAMTGALQWSEPVAAWTGVAGDWARTYPAIDGATLVLGDGAGFRQLDGGRRSHRPWRKGDRRQRHDRRPDMVNAGRDISRRVYHRARP